MSASTYDAFTAGDWWEVSAASPIDAAAVLSTHLELEKGARIVVRSKDDTLLRYEIGNNPRQVKPRGRTNRVPR